MLIFPINYLVINYLFFAKHSITAPHESNIVYSQFLQQLHHDNVKKVVIHKNRLIIIKLKDGTTTVTYNPEKYAEVLKQDLTERKVALQNFFSNNFSHSNFVPATVIHSFRG